ncbi:MAG: carboxypeptidase-like regulatory domain-containing protein [Bacteroidota bacterium]|nr:carboxypeptidase-like regulatory domain-containing protein [Bacteroidota bacterium]
MKNSMYFPSSSDWSSRDTIVEIDASEYGNINSPDYRTQTYYMQVFRNGADWWGLVGMYRVGNNGGETNDFPYTYPEYTSDVELLWSDNGEDWYRTNNHQPIIALHDSIRTIYSVATIVGDSVYFYSSESTILHATYKVGGCAGISQDSAFNGKYYSIYLYKMSISKLNEWRPPSVVSVTSTIEGFLNTGSGKHNIKDTLIGELRNSTTPYAMVSTVKAVIDSVTFMGTFNFPHVQPGSYYLTIEGRNSLETWSSSGITIANGITTTYNFTTLATQAYGSNLTLRGGKYCIFSGDVDNDGFIDVADGALIDNDAINFVAGYVETDLTGDYVVDIEIKQ